MYLSLSTQAKGNGHESGSPEPSDGLCNSCRIVRLIAQYLEEPISSSLSVTKNTTRSQILVTRSAIRSRLRATQMRRVALVPLPSLLALLVGIYYFQEGAYLVVPIGFGVISQVTDVAL